MTFPTWISTTETPARGTGNAFSGNMPASGIVAGDLICLIITRTLTKTQTFSQTSGPTFTAVSSPWGSFGTSISSGTMAVYKRIADGTENGGVTNWTSSYNSPGYDDSMVTVIVVRGCDPTTPIIFSSTTGTGNSANPDPPSLTASSANDYLWLAYAASIATASISAYPTNYSTGHSTSGVTNCTVASALRALNASTEDPGAFTFSGSNQWGAKTLAFAPPSTNTIRSQAIFM